MEEVKRWDITNYPDTKNLARKAVFSLLKSFTIGSMALKLPNGDIVTTGEDCDVTDAIINIKNERFFRRCVLGGDIAFGEAYVDGDWDTPDITSVIRWMIKNVENSGVMSGTKSKTALFNLLGKANRLGHLVKRNTKSGSKQNISFHYDLSNDFYSKWLDPTMTYSCGYFPDADTDLKQAQLNKYQLLCDDLALQPSDHVLEIGCGWGGFMEHAVSKYGCLYTGVTISKEQLVFAQKRAKDLGIEDKVTLLFCDYRDLDGTFDKIVSIEMIEAVGHEFLPVYFGKLQSLLKKNGLLTIQAITSPDSRYNEFRKGVDWIQKHIFPGSLLPSVSAMSDAVRKTGDMHLVNLRDIGTHYAKTLNMWSEAFNKEWDKIHPLGFDQSFKRKWNYYLSYCEAAFEMRNISDVQLTWTRANNTSF